MIDNATMTLGQHQPLAAAIMNPNLTVKEKIANCGIGLACEVLELSKWMWPHELDYRFVSVPWHLDRKREIIGELGDLCWYSAVMADSYGRFVDQTVAPLPPREWLMEEICRDVEVASADTPVDPSAQMAALEAAFFQLADHAEVAAGLVKWHIYHQHEFTPEIGEKIRNALRGTIKAIKEIAAIGCGTLLGEVLHANIEKLRRRYPSGRFSVEDSVNRSD